MLYVLLTLNALTMLVLPLLLGIWLASRWRTPWRLYFVGAATFILSQVGHIPFNTFVLNPQLERLRGPGELSVSAIIITALLLGLSAGLFEESARYAVYRWWIRDARTWAKGLMFGAGHGGVEAIILGLLALVGVVNVHLIQSGLAEGMIPAEQAEAAATQLAAAREEIAALVNGPWYNLLAGGLERVFALAAHLAMALLVLQSLVRRNLLWLGAAIGWHTLLNAVAVFGSLSGWAVMAIEGSLALVTLGSLAIIWGLRRGPYPTDEVEDATATEVM